jgi:hypothetical protein
VVEVWQGSGADGDGGRGGGGVEYLRTAAAAGALNGDVKRVARSRAHECTTFLCVFLAAVVVYPGCSRNLL